MIKFAFVLPEHLRSLATSEFGEHLRLSLDSTLLPGVHATISIQPADGNPDLFYVFVRPDAPLGSLRVGYHHYSPKFPVVTREMFDDPATFGRFVNQALDAFKAELLAARLERIAGPPDRAHIAAIEAFTRDFPSE